jgi:hypothetical protein
MPQPITMIDDSFVHTRPAGVPPTYSTGDPQAVHRL